MDLTAEERAREKAMMADPGRWPRWPILPLKQRNPDRQFEDGIMVAVHGCQLRVYRANMYALGSGPIGQLLHKFDYKEYPDLDGILDDGWVVD